MKIQLWTSWQDAVLSVCEIVFIVSLIPSLTSPLKPSAYTSASTGVALLAFAVVQYSYRNWWTMLLTTGAALCWLMLLVQVVT